MSMQEAGFNGDYLDRMKHFWNQSAQVALVQLSLVLTGPAEDAHLLLYDLRTLYGVEQAEVFKEGLQNLPEFVCNEDRIVREHQTRKGKQFRNILVATVGETKPLYIIKRDFWMPEEKIVIGSIIVADNQKPPTLDA